MGGLALVKVVESLETEMKARQVTMDSRRRGKDDAVRKKV
jgi:hypothetical protein